MAEKREKTAKIQHLEARLADQAALENRIRELEENLRNAENLVSNAASPVPESEPVSNVPDIIP